jgi:transposase
MTESRGTRDAVAKEARAILRRLQDGDGGHLDAYEAGLINTYVFDSRQEPDRWHKECLRMAKEVEQLTRRIEQLTAQVVDEENRRVEADAKHTETANVLYEITKLIIGTRK